ncbi:MAG: hypothetical protein ACREDP_10540, partial [Bradyrhizobium sp.]
MRSIGIGDPQPVHIRVVREAISGHEPARERVEEIKCRGRVRSGLRQARPRSSGADRTERELLAQRLALREAQDEGRLRQCGRRGRRHVHLVHREGPASGAGVGHVER